MDVLLRTEWLDSTKKYPFPDWRSIHKWVSQRAENEQTDTWNQLAREWLLGIGSGFSSQVTLAESTNFILARPSSYKFESSCLTQLETHRSEIVRLLGALAQSHWASKCAVIIPPSHDDFVTYLLDYMPDGTYGLPGGVYISRGYGHFVLPNGDLTQHSGTIAHELCHALIGTRDMPSWLNEAVTQTVEQQVTRRNPYRLNRAIIEEHRAYWTQERLSAFWNGKSFFFPDDGSRLSYHLALFIYHALSQFGNPLINDFLLKAQRKDAGFSAADSVLGVDLNSVVAEFLGWKEKSCTITTVF